MVDSPPSPPPINPNAPQGSPKVGDESQVPPAGFKTKPMHWLGMDFTAEQSAQLWQAITQSVNSEIQRDKEKSIKAIRDLGKDSDDS
jgi:hypothetical protein